LFGSFHFFTIEFHIITSYLAYMIIQKSRKIKKFQEKYKTMLAFGFFWLYTFNRSQKLTKKKEVKMRITVDIPELVGELIEEEANANENGNRSDVVRKALSFYLSKKEQNKMKKPEKTAKNQRS